MKLIRKDEKDVILKHIPYASITICNRQSSHKKYFVEETPSVMALLQKYNDERVVKSESDKAGS